MSTEYEAPVASEAPAFYTWDEETWYYNKRMGYHLNRAGSLLHRSLWAKVHGEIEPGHEVNHINRVRWDNRLENLELLPISDHRRLSCEQREDSWKDNQTPEAATERLTEYWKRREPVARVCEECGDDYASTGMRAKYCGPNCRAAAGRRKNRDAREQRSRGLSAH